MSMIGVARGPDFWYVSPMDTKRNPSALIVYLSPHGTTRQAVETLAGSLGETGLAVDVYNLIGIETKSDVEALHQAMASCSLLVFGCPTYFHHAPPGFMDFMENIPEAAGGQAAAVLSTFGGVSSGVVQFDLARGLDKKGYRLVGGIQVLTEHCLTFQQETPFYQGHPDETDLGIVREFGKEISRRLKNLEGAAYGPADFKDKPWLLNFIDAYFNSLKTFAWTMPGVRVNKDSCTACGLCVKNCPAHNIALDGVAVHGTECCFCYCCVRTCPAGAATAFLKPTAAMPRYFARIFSKYEKQVTRQVV